MKNNGEFIAVGLSQISYKGFVIFCKTHNDDWMPSEKIAIIDEVRDKEMQNSLSVLEDKTNNIDIGEIKTDIRDISSSLSNLNKYVNRWVIGLLIMGGVAILGIHIHIYTTSSEISKELSYVKLHVNNLASEVHHIRYEATDLETHVGKVKKDMEVIKIDMDSMRSNIVIIKTNLERLVKGK